MIKKKIDDLIIQATTEKSHYYVRSVLLESKVYIERLEAIVLGQKIQKDAEIERLKERLLDADAVADWYGDRESWCRMDSTRDSVIITWSDVDDPESMFSNGKDGDSHGGKRARAYRAQYPKGE